uniref:Uncharacterized protein n=1 Tax=Arundo donax TaxID=35708 RepID=A0A0A9DGD9_ARUDO
MVCSTNMSPNRKTGNSTCNTHNKLLVTIQAEMLLSDVDATIKLNY